MKKTINNIGVLTSGGDAPGMNAAIRAVVKACVFHNIKCFGIKEGYNGLINGYIEEIQNIEVEDIIHRGGTILKTARSESFRTPEGRKKAYENCQKYNLDAIVVIGGDGSFTGAMIFEKEFNIPSVGIPGTIDNDIYGSDYTLGFDTALNTIVEAIDKIRDTASSHNRLFFIEVMGRDAGYLALYSGIASGAQDILIPEVDEKWEDLFGVIKKNKQKGITSSIIVVAEGEKLANVYNIAQKTKEEFPDFDVRVTVLGHIQRGGSPSCYDRLLGSRLGVSAVETLLEGKSNIMVGVKGLNNVIQTPFEEAIKKYEIFDFQAQEIAKKLNGIKK